MSHEAGAAETGAQPRPRTYRGGFHSLKSGAGQLAGMAKVFARLGPKQAKDELQIAVQEMKAKGIGLGIGAALVVVGLVFLLLAVVALVIAAVAGLAHVMPAWLAALLIALLFLIILAVLALVGISKIKKQLPLKPESAIFGLLYDLGVVKEGSDYTATRLRREMREKEEAKEAEKAEQKRRQDAGQVPEQPKPSQDQLEARTKARRDHLKNLRDDLGSQSRRFRLDFSGLAGKSADDVRDVPVRAKSSAAQLASNVQDPEALKARWKPLTALAVSVSAFFVFLGRLLRRR